MKRRITTVLLGVIAALLIAPAAYACGFLVSPNGSIRLGKTTTFVAWEDGIERYITNFTFEGPAEPFGSLIPLPAAPTDVTRAGDWTLQRLKREVSPPLEALTRTDATPAPTVGDVNVLLRTRIDSLDIVVLEGGGADVLAWVNDNGFNLPEGPQTDHMLDYYGSRSPYFLAARFDPDAAADDEFVAGDGVPIQITMPTERPWVPLHILHGAAPDSEIIEADVFLLTPEQPDLLYGEGLFVDRSEPASTSLLDDLRSDTNMEWVPDEGWFTYLRLDTEASNVVYDLSVGVGDTRPSFVDAGFMRVEPTPSELRSVGIHWILDQPPTPEVVLTAQQIEALGFARVSQIELTQQQINALSADRSVDTGRIVLIAATVAILAGFAGGIVVVAMSRRRGPEARAGAQNGWVDVYDRPLAGAADSSLTPESTV